MISRAHDSLSQGRAGRPARIDESAPPLVLEIRNGQTQFPLRPVTRNRFLIGAGEGCDLRLGGSGMPPLHSMVQVDGDEILLEAVAPAPPLTVNGRKVDSVTLEDGDRISIGSFELLAHRPQSAATALPPGAPLTQEVIGMDSLEERDLEWDERPLSDLSAAELVERIEAEEELVEQYDQRRQTGAAALLAAIAGHRSDSEIESRPTIPLPRLSENHRQSAELARLVHLANELASELQQQSAQQAAHEAAQARLTEAVFESQQELAIRLESLVARISQLERRKPRHYPKVA